MGLLDRFVGGGVSFEVPENPSRSDIQNAVSLIGIASIGADGHFANNEIIELINSLIDMPLYSNVTSRDELLSAEKMFDKDRQKSIDWAKDVCNLSGWSNTAFVLACSLVFTDGAIDEDETSFIDTLQYDLGVSDDFAAGVASTYSSLFKQP